SIVTDASAGGDPRVTLTTITKGPGAPVGAGSSVTTRATVDLHGKVVDSTDAAGVRAQTTYDDLERPVTVVMTPPQASGAAPLTFAYSYRSRDSQVDRVTVNGVDATRVSYDSATGQITTFTYAGGAATVGLGRFGNGVVNRVTVTSGATRFSSSAEMTAAGRITGQATSASGAVTFTERRSYRYDAATRLASARIVSDQAGVAPTTDFAYAYATQSAGCGGGYPAAGKDSLRTGGSRGGTAYVTCYDDKGRPVSTTDPLVTGGTGTATLRHDALGRVTSITGATRPVSFTWGVGGEVAVMREAIDTTTPITTTLDTYGGTVLRKTVTSASGTSRLVYAGPWNLTADDSGAVTGVESLQYSLPGGAIVTIPPGGTAVLQVPGVDGSALALVPVPTLGSGGSTPAIAAAPRFGPYGEPLTPPATNPSSGRPMYGWQGAAGVETLAGSTGIALMGARAYAPALGQFLSPDPLVDSGDNVYSYTSGDPINSSDLPGTEEQTDMYMLVGAAVAAVISGLLLIRSSGVASIFGTVLGLGAAGLAGFVAVKSFSDDNVLMGSLAAAVAVAGVVTGAVNIYKGVGHYKAWQASRVAQKAKAQQQAASVVPTNQDELAEYIRAEATKMRQAQAQAAAPQATSAPKLPEWAAHLDQGAAPSSYLTTAPPGKMTLGEINTMRFQSPGADMAWSFNKSTQAFGAIDEFTFTIYSAEGRVVSRYNNVIVLI
ncbi:MAG: RHS repeat-associated core domain-containing protein, partial [Candidatus Nanopelagicales bacterium]